MNKSLKITLFVTVGLIIIAIISKKIGWIGKEDGIAVTIDKVKKRNITELVSASGKIQPEIEVKISPDVSGEIVALYITEGQAVKKGDLLCKINPMIYESNRDKMEAMVNSSKANFSNANARLTQAQASFINIESSYHRTKKLFEQDAVSQSEMDIATAQYNAAKADLDALKQNIKAAEFNISNSLASLKEANENLDRTSILSPVSGRISKLNIEMGERVVGTSQMAGTELFRIADLNEMEVLVDVNENDIVRVSVNDSADIEVDAYLGKKFKGVVTEIANSATNIDNNTGADQITNFAVKVRILQESYSQLISSKNSTPFHPGMTATVDIRTKTELNVLSIPIQCVTQRTDTSSTKNKNKKMSEDENKNPIQIVFLSKNGKAVARVVETGIQDNDNIQITKGLQLNEDVISAPYKAITKRLKNSDKIKIVSKEELPSLIEKEEN